MEGRKILFARVCLNCQEYITVSGFESYEYCNMKIHSFDLDHENHSLITIKIDDFDKLDEFLEVNYFYNQINYDVFEKNIDSKIKIYY